ncbi:MAG: ATP-binding protein, partial [Chloroflexota bacterium]
IDLDLERIPLSELLNDLDQTIQPMMLKHNNVFEVDSDPELVEIVSDPQKIKQILLNLLSNAAKFTKDGTVTLSVSPTIGEMVNFSVVDSGVGIPKQALERIFESFRQIDNSHSRSFDGTGLGLTISKRLAHILNGTIRVESEPNVGTTFTLSLPAVHPEFAEPTLPNNRPPTAYPYN